MRRWGTTAAAGGMSALVLVFAVGAFAGAPAPSNGMLGYSYQQDRSTFQLGTVNPDGSGSYVGPQGRSRPLFSPDGNRELVWDFNGTGGAHLYVRNIDGSQETPIAPVGLGGLGIIYYASWSPDGSKIAFMLSDPSNLADAEVWTMNADGTNQSQVTSDAMGKGPIDWAMTPSGSKLAYIGARPLPPNDPCYGWQLWIMNPDGSAPACVPSVAATGQQLAYGAASGHIAWSPDTTRIAVTSTYCGNGACGTTGVPVADIWIVDLTAGTATDLMNAHGYGAFHASSVAWAPDGSELAVTGYVPQPDPATGGVDFAQEGVYTMPATGGTPTLVTPAQPAGSLVDIGEVDWQACTAGITTTCKSVVPAVRLDVTVSGPGHVTSVPAGVDCPGSCGASFPAGTQVTLTATPSAGASFDQWAGACAGGQSTCTVTLDAAATAAASFIGTGGSGNGGGGNGGGGPSSGRPGTGTRGGACGTTTAGVRHLCGTRATDDLTGTAGRDVLEGRGGADRLDGRAGADWLLGGPGDDSLFGGPGRDRLDGGAGADQIAGGPGRDLIIAGTGNDTIDVTGGGSDTVRCGPGSDIVRADRTDILVGCEIRRFT